MIMSFHFYKHQVIQFTREIWKDGKFRNLPRDSFIRNKIILTIQQLFGE